MRCKQPEFNVQIDIIQHKMVNTSYLKYPRNYSEARERNSLIPPTISYINIRSAMTRNI